MAYNRHDLKELIDRLCLDKSILDYRFGYTDPKTLDKKVAGKMPLTQKDEDIIWMLNHWYPKDKADV